MITHEAKLFAQNGLEVPEIFLSSPSHLRIDEHRGFAYFTQSHDKLSALIRQFNGAQRGTYEDQFHIDICHVGCALLHEFGNWPSSNERSCQAHRGCKERRQGYGLRLLQGFGRQSSGGRIREKISIRQYGVLSSGKDALLARYMLEARTGTYLADVYQSSVFPIMNLVEKGLLAKYYSPEREGYIEALRDKEGYWHATYLNAA